MRDKYENISDELLAAFLDGNTTREEMELVLEAMSEDRALMEVADIAENVISFEDKLDVWKGDYGYWELGIDPVLDPEEILKNTAAFFENENLYPEIETDYSIDDDFNHGYLDENSGLDDFNTDDTFNNDLF